MYLIMFESVEKAASEGLVIDPASLYSAFEQVRDGRKQKGKRYPLPLLLTLLMLGKRLILTLSELACCLLEQFLHSRYNSGKMLMRENGGRKVIVCKQKSLFERLDALSQSFLPCICSNWLPAKKNLFLIPKRAVTNMRCFVP